MPWVCLDLWELELSVVGVHLSDLLLGGGAKDLDDLYQLVHTTVSQEDWLTQQQLCKHTTCTPDVWERRRRKIFRHKAVHNASFLPEAQGVDIDIRLEKGDGPAPFFHPLAKTKMIRIPTNVTGIVCSSKNEFKCSVVP